MVSYTSQLIIIYQLVHNLITKTSVDISFITVRVDVITSAARPASINSIAALTGFGRGHGRCSDRFWYDAG